MAGQPKQLSRALDDIVQGLTKWRVWYSMGINDIRQRYRRSRIGQFWLTISMAINIGAMGIVFSILFNMNTREYLPFAGASLTTWALISSLVNEMAASFISSESYLRNYPGPRSIVIYRAILRNLILFAHNLILIPPLMIYGGNPIGFTTLLFLVGVFLIAINSIWIGLLLGTLCVRFRDMQQIVQNFVAVIFFLTPVMYLPEQLVHRLPALIYYNPFSVFLQLVRAPFLGQVPELYYYLYACATTVVGFAIAIPFYARFRSRIVYWL